MLQIDALAYADLRRAMELGYTPTLSRLVNEDGFTLRRWFCGLPSATPYCQAGIFHGENDGIPAFRFYDKAARRVVTCNAPEGVQYIRDRIRAPGALAEGSSYVNLLDGDASTVAFTVATRGSAGPGWLCSSSCIRSASAGCSSRESWSGCARSGSGRAASGSAE